MLDIKYIKSLYGEMVNKDVKNEISEGIKILENISIDSSELKELIVLHKLKSVFIEQSISIKAALKKENMVALNFFHDFDFSKKEKEVNICQDMINKSMSSFNFLKPVSVLNAIDSIYDSFNEFSRMKFSSYPNNSGDLEHVDVFNDKKMVAYSHYDALIQLKDKPHGYYLFDINSNMSGSFTTTTGRTERHIISHQKGGMFVAEFYSTEFMCGYTGHISKYKTPFFERNKDREIIEESSSKELSLITNKSSLFYSHSQKILLGISFVCSLIHSKRKEVFNLSPQKNLISFGEKMSNSKEIIALSHSTHHIKDFTLEDLKFTGDFESLSIFDDLFSNLLEKHIDYINFRRDDSENKVYVLWDGKEKNIEKPFIKELKAYDEVMGYSGNHPILKSIPLISLFNNKEEGIEKIKLFAIQNKLSLIRFYIQHKETDLFSGVIEEINDIAMDNIDFLVRVVRTKVDSGDVLEVSGAKQRWINYFYYKDVVLLSDSHKKLKSRKDSDPVVVRNYLGKSNSTHIIYFTLSSVIELLNLFGKKDISELPDRTKVLAKLINVSEKMKQYSEKHSLEAMPLSNIDYNKSRPEMTLLDFTHSFKFALPVNKKELSVLIPSGIYRKKW